MLVSQSVIPGLGKLGGAAPMAFTEQGVAMLSSVLRSERAVEVNIAIMRTFVQLRRLMDSNALRSRALCFSAFQNLSISAFTSRTRLPHHPIRPSREKTTQTPETMMEDRRSWIDGRTKRRLLIFPNLDPNHSSGVVVEIGVAFPHFPAVILHLHPNPPCTR
jgi:hypothetical protein